MTEIPHYTYDEPIIEEVIGEVLDDEGNVIGHEVIGHEVTGMRTVRVDMPDGPFTVDVNKDTGKVTGRYLTPDEVLELQAKAAAFEPQRIASIKALEMERAIQALAPVLISEFNKLSEEEQIEFASTFDSVEKRLGQGQITFARAMVASKTPLTQNGEAVKAKLLKCLDGLLTGR